MTPLFGDGRSGYDRVAHDWYVEPEWAVASLFQAERFVGRIHDPACGAGNIPRVARDFGYRATGSDLVDRGAGDGCRAGVDFLASRPRADNIVCNPPYDRDEAFVLHALACARRKVAMLLRLPFLEGVGRFTQLFDRFPPSRVLVFKRRVSMPPGGAGIRPKGGKMAFQWLVWERGFADAPRVGWI